MASGYLKIVNEVKCDASSNEWKELYELSITNFEVMVMFRNIVRDWFALTASNYNAFIRAFLQDDLKAMNAYMNKTALATFSFLTVGADHPGRTGTILSWVRLGTDGGT